MDYGRDLQFGYFLTPAADNYAEISRLAQLCDRLGYDLIGIQDHPYQRRFFDTWTLIAALAAQTSRIRFFPDVADLPLRPPAMLAKAVASLDIISSGRIELGLGTGVFWEGIAAMGGPSRSPGEAVAALEEAIQVIRLLWSGERSLRFDGDHYSLKGAHSGPLPVHPVALWIGAYGPKMLNLTGRLGDGWVPSSSYAGPDRLLEMHSRIDEAAASAGRDPRSIQRIYNVMGQIGKNTSTDFFNGPPDQWVDELTRLVLEYGMDTFILGLPDPPGDQLERFMDEIIPRVKETVAAERD